MIKSDPDPICSYWAPALGVVISAVAAVIAALALRRIGKQIKIANDQIDLAQKQITLANDPMEGVDAVPAMGFAGPEGRPGPRRSPRGRGWT